MIDGELMRLIRHDTEYLIALRRISLHVNFQETITGYGPDNFDEVVRMWGTIIECKIVADLFERIDFKEWFRGSHNINILSVKGGGFLECHFF
jgi:hypothetical protein